jgi:HTH-type transcriptional regulator/antitoxin HigA
LRPLRTEADLDAAVAVIDDLIDQAALAPEQDYLDVLSDLVEAYETETIPMRPVGDAELLRFFDRTQERHPGRGRLWRRDCRIDDL